jgi:hypothetical protein
MRALLVRVAADQSEGGGFWNGPMDSCSREFAYIAIPESSPLHHGLNKPYAGVRAALAVHGANLPPHLASRDMHLDPDFEHLTYGDQGERAKQISAKVGPNDLLVFYAGMRDVHRPQQLVYALIGLFIVNEIVPAVAVPVARRHENAHTRRVVAASDIVVRACPDVSGRFEKCIPIGDYREGAYRVWPHLLTAWGGLTVKNGYLQRSARLPEFCDAARFYDWFLANKMALLARNN